LELALIINSPALFGSNAVSTSVHDSGVFVDDKTPAIEAREFEFESDCLSVAVALVNLHTQR